MSQVRTPTDVTTLKALLATVLETTIPNLKTFREKEWAMLMLNTVKGQQAIRGDRRHIKHTGVARPIDELGRIVVPSEIRKEYGMDAGTEVEFTLDEVNNWIVLEPVWRTCNFCGAKDDVHQFKEKHICEQCLAQMVETL